MISPQAAAAEIRRRRLAALAANNFVPHVPTPRQAEFLATDAREVLYGGAAGGGKTDAALMAAAQYIHVPGYAALVIRRNYKQLSLPGAILDRAKAWWCGVPGIRWNADEYRFTFPSGATITFGYLDCEADKWRYQGAEFQCLVPDELTQFPELWYRYLLSRLRRLASSDVPIRVRATSNPGGIGHDWVYRRFVQPGAVGAFVPAYLADNPHIDVVEYAEQLALLDPITRKQLLEGVWIRDGAGLVYACFDDANLIDVAPRLQYHVLALDFGVVDENAFAVLGWRDNDPNVYVVAAYRFKGLVDDVAAEIKRLEQTYNFVKVVGDIGGMGKLFAEELTKRHGINIEGADKANKLGFIRLLNSALHARNIKVLQGACGDLVGEWLELPWHESRLKEADGFNNHAADACLYGWRACVAYHEVALADQPQKGSREALEREADELEARLTAPREEEFE